MTNKNRFLTLILKNVIINIVLTICIFCLLLMCYTTLVLAIEGGRDMLTINKVLLVAEAQSLEQFVFEAIEPINDLEVVEEVWSNNKIPVILREFYEADPLKGKHKTLFVPTELRDENDFIAFCHGNKFECGEVCRGQKFDTTKDECFLCYIGEHKGMSVTEFNISTPKYSDIIIYESENFFVKIELGCLIPGMVMINPKKHHYSMARLPEDQFEEYYEVMRDTEMILKGTYGKERPVIFFEHGSAPTGFSSHAKSIVHAHTHVAIGCAFEKKYLDMVKLQPVTEIKSLYKAKYMSYQCGTNGVLLAVSDPKVYVQRQFPRQVIAHMFGIPNELSNWRVEPFYENICITFKNIWDYLDTTEDIPERIIQRTKGFYEALPLRTNWSE